MIDNPYLGLQNVGLNRFHDCHSLKIPVPCGNCASCIALRQSYYIQRTQMESIDNHLFMLTLTYSTPCLRFLNINGRKLYYADFTDVQKMFKRLRNRGLKFSYMVVSEYGSTHHRPHFHAIISVPKGPKDTYHDIMNLECHLYNMFLGEWRRNYGSDKKPRYKALCHYIVTPRGRTYDLHYIHPAVTANGEDDVCFYVTKYVTKSDMWLDRLKSALKLNLSPERFEEVWKLLKPRCCISKGFGNYQSDEVKKHIRQGIELAKISKSEFPFFINPHSGQTFPLAPTFKRRFLTLEDQEFFFSLSEYSDGYKETDQVSVMQHHVKDVKLKNIRHNINSRLTSNDFLNEDISNISPEELEKGSDSPFRFSSDDFVGCSDFED